MSARRLLAYSRGELPKVGRVRLTKMIGRLVGWAPADFGLEDNRSAFDE